jgi:protein-tyrosine phosphatase
MQRVLFLCTGNYYRSRFAEIFFNWHAEQRNLAWRAESRGLAIDPANPGPLSRHTRARLEGHRIDYAEYLRFPLDLSLIDLEKAHRIVAVKRAEHFPLMQRRFPEWSERVEFWDVHDIDCLEPDESMPVLETRVIDLLTELERRTPSTDSRARS